MSEEIFREVDEELREENLLRLWRRFGPYVVATVVAVVTGHLPLAVCDLRRRPAPG